MRYSEKREKSLDKILIAIYNVRSLLILTFKAQASTFFYHLQCRLGYYQEMHTSLVYAGQIQKHLCTLIC